MDATARLVLVDLPSRSFATFVRELRDHYHEVDLVTLQDLWDKYMGRDRRVQATHDPTTGERYK